MKRSTILRKADGGTSILLRPAGLLIIAALLHVAITATVFILGRNAVLPATFDTNGIAVSFAEDGVGHREDAATLAQMLNGGEFLVWFNAPYPFHVKLYSLCFVVFGSSLWVRMDIHQGRMGYDRPVHLDHARRLMSMLIYMCDQTENEMSGGELFLHAGETHLPPTCVTPRHNLMVAFPCSSRSHHSVSAIAAQLAPRNYVQVNISSSEDIWPRVPVPGWRRALESLKRHLRRN